MVKNRIIIDDKEYLVEVWVKYDFTHGLYKLNIQAIPRKGTPFVFSGKVSEEYITDEIDNNQNINFIEKVLLKLTNNHLKDLINLSAASSIGNTNYWLKEAKRQLDEGD